MPNSLSIYTTNSNKIRNKNRHRIKIRNKSNDKNTDNNTNKNKKSDDTLTIGSPILSELEEVEVEVEVEVEPDINEYETNCLFCFEPSQETNKLFRMKDVLLVNSTCDCNGNLHMKCLTDWISVSKTCPYCRNVLTINLEILRQVDTFHYSALTAKFSLFIRRFVHLFYAIVMMMTKYIALLFLLNALLRVARDVYKSIDK
jgi:hypothetical protein